MNLKSLLKTLAHAALGGVSVAVALYDPSQPLNAHALLLAGAASAGTSIFSAFCQRPDSK